MLKLLATASLLGAACAQNTSLPEVDLGYQVYRAASFNVRSYLTPFFTIWLTRSQSTGNFYNFSNIRYAAPPIGNLRFAPPQAPATNRSSVDNGGTSRY
jgi:acetylcholinesterase